MKQKIPYLYQLTGYESATGLFRPAWSRTSSVGPTEETIRRVDACCTEPVNGHATYVGAFDASVLRCTGFDRRHGVFRTSNGALDGRVPRHTYFHSSSSVHQQRGRPCAPGLARASGTPTYPPLPPSPSLTLPLPDAALHLPAPSVKDEKTETTNKRSGTYGDHTKQDTAKNEVSNSLLTVSCAEVANQRSSLWAARDEDPCARAIL